MKHYLLDTNILIYYFNGEMENTVENKVSALISESFQISVISEMEFLGFPFSLAEKKTGNAVNRICNDNKISR